LAEEYVLLSPLILPIYVREVLKGSATSLATNRAFAEAAARPCQLQIDVWAWPQFEGSAGTTRTGTIETVMCLKGKFLTKDI